MRTSRRDAYSLVELMIVLAILSALSLEWRPDYTGLAVEARRTAMEVEARTLEHACEAFLRSRGRYASSIEELCDAGILARPPDPYRERESGFAIRLIPSTPGGRDLAGARVVPVAEWEGAVPPGGHGWD